MRKRSEVHASSGNIFEDLGLPHPERLLARAQVMFQIKTILREKHLTQQSAAKLLGIPQSKISCLMNGKLNMFSLDYLFSILNALDENVLIVIQPRSNHKKPATTDVVTHRAA